MVFKPLRTSHNSSIDRSQNSLDLCAYPEESLRLSFLLPSFRSFPIYSYCFTVFFYAYPAETELKKVSVSVCFTPFQWLLYTVDSRYLEIQGTLWNTPRYPYFDIADLRNWGKQIIEQPPLTEWIFNLTPKLEIYWKYCGKEEKLLLRSNFSSFLQYFVASW